LAKLSGAAAHPGEGLLRLSGAISFTPQVLDGSQEHDFSPKVFSRPLTDDFANGDPYQQIARRIHRGLKEDDLKRRLESDCPEQKKQTVAEVTGENKFTKVRERVVFRSQRQLPFSG
jgi:hypothetical protein